MPFSEKLQNFWVLDCRRPTPGCLSTEQARSAEGKRDKQRGVYVLLTAGSVVSGIVRNVVFEQDVCWLWEALFVVSSATLSLNSNVYACICRLREGLFVVRPQFCLWAVVFVCVCLISFATPALRFSVPVVLVLAAASTSQVFFTCLLWDFCVPASYSLFSWRFLPSLVSPAFSDSAIVGVLSATNFCSLF